MALTMLQVNILVGDELTLGIETLHDKWCAVFSVEL